MSKKNNAAAAQAERLKDEQRRANAEAARIQAENQKKADARRRRQLGRSSLINTSELGVTENLG